MRTTMGNISLDLNAEQETTLKQNAGSGPTGKKKMIYRTLITLSQLVPVRSSKLFFLSATF